MPSTYGYLLCIISVLNMRLFVGDIDVMVVQLLRDEWIDWDNGERVVKVILYER